MAEHLEPSYAEVNQDVLDTLLHTGRGYWILLGVSITVVLVCFVGPWIYQLNVGVGASDEFLPVGAVEFDASITEVHTSANEITQYPVEKGVDRTDHVRRVPDRLTITGIVTDHPIIAGGALLAGPGREPA